LQAISRVAQTGEESSSDHCDDYGSKETILKKKKKCNLGAASEKCVSFIHNV
jgi:hypothetical protein